MENLTGKIQKIGLQFGHLTITSEVEERLEELGFSSEELIDEIKEHERSSFDNPSIYCGTFRKYNNGSICGLWIDLTSFYSYSDFINFCKAIHADEADPELMFQDYENFPERWYDESDFDEECFDNIAQYYDLCEMYDAEAVDAFLEWDEKELEDFEECYKGEYDSEEDYARDFIQNQSDVLSMMGDLAEFFDFEKYASSLFDEGDFYFINGYVFEYC